MNHKSLENQTQPFQCNALIFISFEHFHTQKNTVVNVTTFISGALEDIRQFKFM